MSISKVAHHTTPTRCPSWRSPAVSTQKAAATRQDALERLPLGVGHPYASKRSGQVYD